MSAIYDYGKRQKEEGKEEGIEIGKEEGIEIGKEEGIEIGKEEGIIIGNEKMAKYMIKDGKTDEEIQKETELSLEKIQKLRNEL